jgi:murein DD-endopeptidase MepM/ murein hydrolase activator NlpD
MADNSGPLLAVLGAGVVVLMMSRRRKAGSSGKGAGVKAGGSSPIWPIVHGPDPKIATTGGKSLGASRPNNRHHAGIDIIASAGLPLVATEAGTIVAINPWAGADAKSLLLETDSGVVVNYGAVAPNSWKEFGIGVGSRVRAGEPIARIGRYPHGSAMLHFELYLAGTRMNEKWGFGKAPPGNLLNPENYLQRASSRVIS